MRLGAKWRITSICAQSRVHLKVTFKAVQVYDIIRQEEKGGRIRG